MSMIEFRRLAEKIDQHMQQLDALGVSEPHAIINRMMGYVPDLHKILVGISNQQLISLCSEFPGFYCYAHIMEEASEAERHKASRSYDGMPEFSEKHKHMGEQLLTTAATLERTYQAFHTSGDIQVFRPELDELGHLYQQWLCELHAFKESLRMHSAEPKVLEYVNTVFDRMDKRIQQLAG
ncbi:transposase [Pseudomonas amygdali]|uniref:transposase n=1 Tax=Pseudomonas amygdali TaxID=47877 RepID=UPI00211DA9D7|nr:transposase [Pseudomonas amygdali]